MTTELHIDAQFEDEVRGWSFRNEDGELDDGSLVMSMGNVVLGRIERTFARDDVDAALGSPERLKGFSAPVGAPMALARMIDGEALGPRIDFENESITLSERTADLSLFRSLRLADGLGAVTVTDLWLSGTHRLSLRLDEVRTTREVSMRFFQPRGGEALGRDKPALELVDERTLRAREMQVLDVDLANPYLPLLIVILGDEDDIIACDLLPFPSLLRGGPHMAEQRALGATGDYVADLRALSDELVREQIGWPDAGPRSLTAVRAESLRATGAERLFAPAMTEWLHLAFDMKVEPVVAGGPVAAERDLAHVGPEIVRRLGWRAPTTPGAPVEPPSQDVVLTLPPHAIPTISALASRRPWTASTRAGAAAASFLAADESGRQVYLVSLPDLASTMAELQPITQAPAYPTLTGSGHSAAPSAACPSILPVAIAFATEYAPEDERRLFPVPLDHQGPVLSGPFSAASPGGVTVVLSIRNDLEGLRDFLRSAASQTIADELEIVLVNNRSHMHLEGRIRALMEESFAGRNKIVDYDRTENQSAQRNLGAEAADKALLLFATTDIFLHDPRTLEVLSRIAERDDTASASCLLLHAPANGRSAYGFRSAGYFPGSVNFFGNPSVHLTEPNPELALRLATYPVVGNTFALTMVRSDTWGKLGGCNARDFPGRGSDIDYAVRALRAGFLHFCTTGVTAFEHRQRQRAASIEVPSASVTAMISLTDLLSSATALRRI